MKKIVIVGQNSYIGTSLIKHLNRNDYEVTTICARKTNVEDMNFSNVDSVLHVAGIAHASTKSKKKDLYFKINRDLAIAVANKAKESNVKQFIFMSSVIVYGESYRNKEFIIDDNTKFNPNGYYGKSKLEADLAISKLNSPDFKTVIIRSPMVYGPNSKGNFPRLVSLSKKIFIFPKINNYRSIIYIENLCEFIRLIIENDSEGIFMPQNTIQPSSTDIVRLISKHYNKKIFFSKFFNVHVWILGIFYRDIWKIFGNRAYDPKMTQYFNNSYNIVDLEESIKRTLE